MYTVIGSCSLCGGNVLGFTGPWFGTNPPSAYCSKCGAVEARSKNVIPMEKPNKVEIEKDDLTWYSYEHMSRKANEFTSLFEPFEKLVDKTFDKFDEFFKKRK